MRVDPNLKLFIKIPIKNGLNNLSVLCLQEDSIGNSGLMKLPSNLKKAPSIIQEQCIAYKFEFKGERHIPSNIILNIYLDSNDRLWLACDNKLVRSDAIKSRFDVLSENMASVSGFTEFPKGVYWLIDVNNGLSKFTKNYTTHEIIISNNTIPCTFNSLLKWNNNLFLGTDNGLIEYDINARKINHLTTEYGLTSNISAGNDFYCYNDSMLIISTSKGLNVFNPKKISNLFFDSKIHFTDVLLFNKSISIEHSKKPIFTKALNDLNEIDFNYNQNLITFSFSALQTSIPQTVRFSYFLEGFSSEWIELNLNQRSLTFTNLDPNPYILKIKVVGFDGEISKNEASMRIVIHPPWWLTWWFKSLVSILIIISTIAFYKIRTRNIRIRNIFLLKEVEIRTAEIQETNKALFMQFEDIRKKNETIIEQQKELLDKKYELEFNNTKLNDWSGYLRNIIKMATIEFKY
jgi:hypothetical protein